MSPNDASPRTTGAPSSTPTPADRRELAREARSWQSNAEFLRHGMPPAEAHRQALLAFGGLTVAAEAVRAQKCLPGLNPVCVVLRSQEDLSQ